jgi:hypothetical protein
MVRAKRKEKARILTLLTQKKRASKMEHTLGNKQKEAV